MNWIDLILIAVLLLALWSGWQRGFIGGTLALLTWLGSLAAGFFFYPLPAPLLQRAIPSLGVWTNAASFILLVIITRILFNMISTALLRRMPNSVQNHIANRALGSLPGLANGVLQVAVLAALLLALPFENRMSDAARESRLFNTAAGPAFLVMRELTPVFGEPLRNGLPKTAKKGAGAESVKLPYKVTDPETRADLEVKMLVLVNEERGRNGLKPLTADAEVRVVARAHSRDMFARQYFAHVNPDGDDPFARMKRGKIRYVRAGENLALAQTLQQAHDGLMNSPGHRANILQPRFGRVGIGIMDGGIYGLMVTQNFRN